MKMPSVVSNPVGYIISDDNGDKIPHYKIYLKVAEMFKIIEEDEEMCEYYEKALNAANANPDEKEKIQQLINRSNA